LKGLIFCHECGHPLAVLNRKNAAGEDVLYFVCRTYQRFTKARACTSHSIKEKTVTDAVIDKVREVCEAYLAPERLEPIAKEAVEAAGQRRQLESAILAVRGKVDALTANLDKMYLDRLNGLLAEEDFSRIYQTLKKQRSQLETRLKELEAGRKEDIPAQEKAKDLVRQFLDSTSTNRELLVSLIERVELTEDKQIIIRFRCRQLEDVN